MIFGRIFFLFVFLLFIPLAIYISNPGGIGLSPSRTRWQLRRSVKRLHEFFDLVRCETHPDKTQRGRNAQGFDWLGIWFTPTGTAIAPRALENHRVRRARLYGQARRQGLSSTETELRVRTYEARWAIWARRMLGNNFDCL